MGAVDDAKNSDMREFAALHDPCGLCLTAASSLYISSELDVNFHKQRDDY